jgi:hypothetical protein
MDLGLKNKKALVAGASRGLGFATALALSGEKTRLPRPGPYSPRVAFAGARPGLRSLRSLAMTSFLFFRNLIDPN